MMVPPLAGVTVAPLALGVEAGGGVAGGVTGGVVGEEVGHPETVMTGTEPAEENATAHPGGAATCKGMVTLTMPGVVLDVAAGAGVCATAGAALNNTNKILSFLIMVVPLYYPLVGKTFRGELWSK
jgi:hypothetical protein